MTFYDALRFRHLICMWRNVKNRTKYSCDKSARKVTDRSFPATIFFKSCGHIIRRVCISNTAACGQPAKIHPAESHEPIQLSRFLESFVSRYTL